MAVKKAAPQSETFSVDGGKLISKVKELSRAKRLKW